MIRVTLKKVKFNYKENFNVFKAFPKVNREHACFRAGFKSFHHDNKTFFPIISIHEWDI